MTVKIPNGPANVTLSPLERFCVEMGDGRSHFNISLIKGRGKVGGGEGGGGEGQNPRNSVRMAQVWDRKVS